MSSAPTTHLMLFLHPENEEQALSLVTGEILIERETTLVETQEEAGLCQITDDTHRGVWTGRPAAVDDYPHRPGSRRNLYWHSRKAD